MKNITDIFRDPVGKLIIKVFKEGGVLAPLKHNITTKKIDAGNYRILRNGKDSGYFITKPDPAESRWVLSGGTHDESDTFNTKKEALDFLRTQFSWDKEVLDKTHSVFIEFDDGYPGVLAEYYPTNLSKPALVEYFKAKYMPALRDKLAGKQEKPPATTKEEEKLTEREEKWRRNVSTGSAGSARGKEEIIALFAAQKPRFEKEAYASYQKAFESGLEKYGPTFLTDVRDRFTKRMRKGHPPEFNQFIKFFVDRVPPKNPRDNDTFVFSEEKARELAKRYAEEVLGKMAAKATIKLGDLSDPQATVDTEYRFDLSGTAKDRDTGELFTIYINQKSILNRSVLGKIFRQFPALIYMQREGGELQRISEEAYKRRFGKPLADEDSTIYPYVLGDMMTAYWKGAWRVDQYKKGKMSGVISSLTPLADGSMEIVLKLSSAGRFYDGASRSGERLGPEKGDEFYTLIHEEGKRRPKGKLIKVTDFSTNIPLFFGDRLREGNLEDYSPEERAWTLIDLQKLKSPRVDLPKKERVNRLRYLKKLVVDSGNATKNKHTTPSGRRKGDQTKIDKNIQILARGAADWAMAPVSEGGLGASFGRINRIAQSLREGAMRLEDSSANQTHEERQATRRTILSEVEKLMDSEGQEPERATPKPEGNPLLGKDGRYLYPLVGGVPDITQSPVHAVEIGGETRYLTWVEIGGGIGKVWYEFTDGKTIDPMEDRKPYAYSKKDLIEKLEISPEPEVVIEEEIVPVSVLSDPERASEFSDKEELTKVIAKQLRKDLRPITKSARQNYKGTGSQAARRQIWYRFKDDEASDIWIGPTSASWGGVLAGPKIPVIYGDKTVKQISKELSDLITQWLENQ